MATRDDVEARLAFLLRVSDAVRTPADPEAICAELARLLGEHLQADRVGYAEARDGGRAMALAPGYTNGLKTIAGERGGGDGLDHLAEDYGIDRRAFEAGGHVIRADVANDPTLSDVQKARYAAAQVGANAIVPLVRGGRYVGALYVHFRTAHTWTREEIALIEDVAGQAWHAIERARAELALRRSEEQFRTVANLVPEMLWSNDSTGYTDWYNQRWFDYTGQTADEALGFGWLATIHPADRSESLANFRAAAEAGRLLQQEHRIRAADGSYRWFLVRAEPIRDALGTISRWFGAATDVHQARVARDELATRVRSATAELRLLSRRLVTVQEEERRHLARELHDEIGQALTGLQLQLATAGRAGRRRDSLAEAESIVHELAARVRELSLDLRPAALDTLGLLPALLAHVERYQARTGLRIDVRHEGVERRFDAAVEIAAYRVVQEALTNVVRHAQAGAAAVHLLADDETLTLAVRDDGRGFDPQPNPGAGGLRGMRERVELLGGSVAIEAAPGGGTLVTAELPLSGGAGDAGVEDGT